MFLHPTRSLSVRGDPSSRISYWTCWPGLISVNKLGHESHPPSRRTSAPARGLPTARKKCDSPDTRNAFAMYIRTTPHNASTVGKHLPKIVRQGETKVPFRDGNRVRVAKKRQRDAIRYPQHRLCGSSASRELLSLLLVEFVAIRGIRPVDLRKC